VGKVSDGTAGAGSAIEGSSAEAPGADVTALASTTNAVVPATFRARRHDRRRGRAFRVAVIVQGPVLAFRRGA
jgi:hypothetical protein